MPDLDNIVDAAAQANMNAEAIALIQDMARMLNEKKPHPYAVVNACLNIVNITALTYNLDPAGIQKALVELMERMRPGPSGLILPGGTPPKPTNGIIQ